LWFKRAFGDGFSLGLGGNVWVQTWFHSGRCAPPVLGSAIDLADVPTMVVPVAATVRW